MTINFLAPRWLETQNLIMFFASSATVIWILKSDKFNHKFWLVAVNLISVGMNLFAVLLFQFPWWWTWL